MRIRRTSAILQRTVRSLESYAFFVPDGARVNTVDTLPGQLSLVWPDCPGCRFGVAIETDTTHGGREGRIAKIVADQRVIDSINRDPNSEAGEFNDIDGPPRPFATSAGRAYLIDTPDGGRHLCEMTAVAKAFAWRDEASVSK